jgi:hypothetical protein
MATDQLRQLKVPPQVARELNRIMEDMNGCRAGLSFLSDKLYRIEIILWDTILEYFPETKDWTCRYDKEKEEITLLSKKRS